jgi:hypothetical protein
MKCYSLNRKGTCVWVQWLKPIILATRKAEIREDCGSKSAPSPSLPHKKEKEKCKCIT